MLAIFTKQTESSPFSEFIRNASSREKKKVYKKVIEEATVLQLAIIEQASASVSASTSK